MNHPSTAERATLVATLSSPPTAERLRRLPSEVTWLELEEVDPKALSDLRRHFEGLIYRPSDALRGSDRQLSLRRAASHFDLVALSPEDAARHPERLGLGGVLGFI